MKIGDFVRDRAGLGGRIERFSPGIPCRVFVAWNNGEDGWINIKWLRVERR